MKELIEVSKSIKLSIACFLAVCVIAVLPSVFAAYHRDGDQAHHCRCVDKELDRAPWFVLIRSHRLYSS
ncbi:hypothetical protein ACFQ88_25025 [Paenibacillus sp. NPDC056579]|uniref:hypothetical protein n=1 Tax=Paenibacillus sp. NPDC056579 TaxID=3345871 RepID=UPI0036B4D4F2